MGQVENPTLVSVGAQDTPVSAGFGDQIKRVTGFLRRRYLSIIICLLLSLPFGLLYYFLAPRTYIASAGMLLETQRSQLSESLAGGTAARDSVWVESQIGILRSQNVAGYVVKQLRLAEDPQFVRSRLGPFDKLLERLGWGSNELNSEAERVAVATTAVMDGLKIRRNGQSYLISIEFHGSNAGQAAKITDMIIDGYIFDQLNAKYQANRRAGDWLQERLQSLREQAATAERAVIDFKTKNNIVAAGGALMNEKQLGDMSGRLATVRARAMELQARLERITAVRQAYQQEQPVSGKDENVSEAMSNQIIGQLRGRYLDLLNREADFSLKYGANHQAVLNLRNQLRDVRRSIRDELGRIEETTKSEYLLAKKQQDEAEQALAGLVSQSTTTNQAQVTLFSLEAAAQSYRKLYDNFLQRHTESVQQQSLPITDARMISSASVATANGKVLKNLMTIILGGGILGVGLGLFREMRDQGFKTRDQVRSILDTECLALVPVLPKQAFRLFRGQQLSAPQLNRTAMLPVATAGLGGARKISPNARVWESIVDTPSSPGAEAIRSLKLGLDLKRSKPSAAQVVGLTSCLPGEGKSTIASAMAVSIAQAGAKVLLVDCDLRNPSLSRTLAPDARVGFLEVLDGDVTLADAVWQDPVTKMDFLPTTTDPLNLARIDIFSSSAADTFFKTLPIKYDYVIVDLAPLVAGVDVRATLRHIDSQVLVIEWGSTKVDQVEYGLRHAPGVRERIAGVVLNKVDMAAMSLYDRHGANYYYGRPRYSSS